MTPMQQIFLGMGAVATKTYVDDVFSTYLYTGSNTSTAYNNGINLSESGGMVWIKDRDTANEGMIFDTERGVTKYLIPSDNYSEATQASNSLTSFNNNGFTLGNWGYVNSTGPYASWSFRKSPMFDIVTYTGNGSNRTISHSLGSVPGFMLIKRTDDSDNWFAYHCKSPNATTSYLKLNNNSASQADGSGVIWNSTAPTSTVFSVGTDGGVNDNGGTYVAYLFAGGPSDAATARSVEFDGSGDALIIPDSTDLDLGTTFTWEFYIKMNNLQDWYVPFRRIGSSAVHMQINAAGQISYSNCSSANGAIPKGQWTHCALVVNSGVGQWYINGTASGSTSSNTTGSGYNGNLCIGGWGDTVSYYMNGSLSNVRLVAGTAVYTSSFRPPTEPLANITNTVLLCCNDSSVTGSSVTPGTISSTGNPTASTDSPFDDPAGFKFGDAGDQNVIKCGSVTTDSSNGATLHLPWEPQWFLFKRTDASYNWTILDSMRGWTADGTVKIIHPNLSNAETGGGGYEELKARTIKFQGYGNNYNFIWIAIRRPDGYVGKPVELGSDCFAMDIGNNGAGAGAGDPSYDSNFPVDFSLFRKPASTEHWITSARLMGTNYVKTNTADAESSTNNNVWDYNDGWRDYSAGWTEQSWMWSRRGQGFDVVAYIGNGNNTDGANAHAHSLGKVPEMIWIKSRSGGANSGSTHWSMSSKGLNGGTNPWQYTMILNETNAEAATSNFGNTAPTSTHFYVGEPGNGRTNDDGADVIAFLFASVDGICKVGYYTGTESQITITTGFQPRFVLIKRTDSSTNGDWYIYDTLRGLSGSFGTGNTNRLSLDSNAAQGECGSCLANFATGFYVGTSARHNTNNGKYIYYCHA